MKRLKRMLMLVLCASMMLGMGMSGAKAEETVVWWTWSTEATEAYQQLAAMVTKKYPEVKVDLQFIANKDYWTKMPVAIASGTGPDVFQMTRPSFELYAASKQATDLTEVIASSQALQENLKQMDETLVNSYQFNGKQMAIPYTVEATAIAYNKTIFKEAGLADLKEIEATWTWNDLREIANKLTLKDASGNVSQYGFLVGADRLPTWELIWSHEAEMFNETKDSCQIADPKIVEALQILVDMYQDGVSPTTDATSTMSADDMFMSGKIAMIPAGIWKMPTFRGITSFEWDVVELPHDAMTGKRISSSNVLGFVVNPNSKNISAATKFLEVVTSMDGQAVLANTKTYIPANVNARDGYFEADVPVNIKAYQRALSYLHPNTLTQFIPYSQFLKEYTSGLRDAYNGVKTLQEAMTERQENINQIMN